MRPSWIPPEPPYTCPCIDAARQSAVTMSYLLDQLARDLERVRAENIAVRLWANEVVQIAECRVRAAEAKLLHATGG